MNLNVRLLWLAVSVMGVLAPGAAMAAERAIVTSESAPLYLKMSTESDIVAHLGKGELVTIDVSLMGSDGMWCAVTQVGEGRKSGYMHADLLQRESIVEGSGRRAATVDAKPPAPAPPVPAPREASQVYFVPIGDLVMVDLQYLVSYYEQKYHLHVETLAPVALDPAAFNVLRQQYTAEDLVLLVERGYPELANDRRAILIGITESDMYTSNESWRFCLGWRQQNKFAVVSGARMDLIARAQVVPGAEMDSALFHSRLRKMISREIGFMYYQLPVRSDPKSVLRPTIMSVSDLDDMGEDF